MFWEEGGEKIRRGSTLDDGAILLKYFPMKENIFRSMIETPNIEKFGIANLCNSQNQKKNR